MPAIEIPLPPNSRLKPENRFFAAYGSHVEAMLDRHDEVLLAGPAGTGKTRAVLEKVNFCAQKYPGFKGMIVRKTRDSLTNSAQIIWEQRVVRPGSPESRIHYQTQRYRYKNGSFVALGGLDKSSKVMSSEYDMIAVIEATELAENEWEDLTTRLRAGVMPYHQIVGDCNPQGPTHWLYQRSQRIRPDGLPVLRMHTSTHRDNPMVTGDYLRRLRNLTGIRYKRLYKGEWAAAEGLVYESWGENRERYLVNRFEPAYDWPRLWVVDFGFIHPFVWQEWAIDPDGRMYRTWEIYRTRTLVEDHARAILAHQKLFRLPRPYAIACDHDAEDRATLERHLGMATVPARKAVSSGIQAVESRLRIRSDGRPRLFFMRDAHVPGTIDYALVDDAKPLRTEDELDSYVWNPKRPGEPVKQDDHGADATRYAVAHVDAIDDAQPLSLDEEIRRMFRYASLS